MTQKPRDWQKDMEMCERYERDEGWSRRDLIAEQPQMSMYWLQEAMNWEHAYQSANSALIREKARADAAEAREQRLKAAVEAVLWTQGLESLVLKAHLQNILSTLYPDTPAPKEGIHEASEIKRRD